MTENAPQMSLEEWLLAAWNDPAAGCPPPEAWLEAEAAALTAEQRRRLDEHAGSCPACAAERDLARTFDDGPAGMRAEDVAFVVSRLEAASPVGRAEVQGKVVPFPAPAPQVRRPARQSAQSPLWRLAVAAVLVIAAGLAFQLSRPGAPPLPAPPPGGPGAVVRGGEIEILSPREEVAGMPAEFRWEPRAGAASYRVRLLAVDDTLLWQAEVLAPPARLPAEVAERLHRAVVYTWTVEALDAAGTRLAVSEPVRFRARPVP
jgi:hypothetical protein